MLRSDKIFISSLCLGFSVVEILNDLEKFWPVEVHMSLAQRVSGVKDKSQKSGN